MTRVNPEVSISLVIPAFNEAELLPRLLDTVDEARRRYRRGAASIEVIVADNGSSDDTGAIASDRGCIVVGVEKRCIGGARNRGAEAASGKILAFVDADIRIHPETFNAIDGALGGGGIVAGATGVRLERWSAGIAATYALLMPLVWGLRMDTGVVFCTADDFESIGGYDESLLYGEDVRFLLDLRRRGRADGRRLIRLRRFKAVASMRKFDRHGDWHYFAMVPRFALGLLGHRRSDGLLRDYWYGAR